VNILCKFVYLSDNREIIRAPGVALGN